MTGEFPALGLNPAPGDVSAVDGLCSAVQRTLQALVEIRSTLHSFGDPGAVWQGEAARAFAGELGELSPYLERAEQSHRAVHQELAAWADDLQRRQLVARSLEDQAEAALRSVLVAGQAAERAAFRVRTASLAETAAVQSAATMAGHRLTVAEQELADLRDRARRLREEHRGEAARVAAAVRAAADVAPMEPGTFERLGSALVTVAAFPGGIGEGVAGVLRDHAHVIGELADVLADATVVAGFVALVVPGPHTAILAVGLALATLGTRAASDAAGVDVATSTYLYDTLAVGAGALGGAAAAGARGGLATAAQGRALGYSGQVRNGVEAAAHYGRIGRTADTAGGSGSAASTGTGVVQNDGDDRPFLHFVPDSKAELIAGIVLGPGATAAVSAWDLGRTKDRAAAAQAERDRWMR